MSLAGVLVLLLISDVRGVAAPIRVGAVIGQAVDQPFNLPMLLVLHVDGKDFSLAWALAWSSLLGTAQAR